MANRQLTAKEQATIEYYCAIDSDSHNNWCKSYLKAGYSKCKNYEANAKRVRDKDIIQVGIEAYKAKTVAKTARTVASVDAMQQAAYDLAMKLNQPSAAVSAGTAIARLYAMDKDNQLNDDQPEPLSEAELATFKRQALQLTNTKVNNA